MDRYDKIDENIAITKLRGAFFRIYRIFGLLYERCFSSYESLKIGFSNGITEFPVSGPCPWSCALRDVRRVFEKKKTKKQHRWE